MNYFLCGFHNPKSLFLTLILFFAFDSHVSRVQAHEYSQISDEVTNNTKELYEQIQIIDQILDDEITIDEQGQTLDKYQEKLLRGTLSGLRNAIFIYKETLEKKSRLRSAISPYDMSNLLSRVDFYLSSLTQFDQQDSLFKTLSDRPETQSALRLLGFDQITPTIPVVDILQARFFKAISTALTSSEVLKNDYENLLTLDSLLGVNLYLVYSRENRFRDLALEYHRLIETMKPGLTVELEQYLMTAYAFASIVKKYQSLQKRMIDSLKTEINENDYDNPFSFLSQDPNLGLYAIWKGTNFQLSLEIDKQVRDNCEEREVDFTIAPIAPSGILIKKQYCRFSIGVRSKRHPFVQGVPKKITCLIQNSNNNKIECKLL